MGATKPLAGHKRERVSYGVDVTCECGWRSGTYFGKGASSFAHQEWRMHIDAHRRANTTPPSEGGAS